MWFRLNIGDVLLIVAMSLILLLTILYHWSPIEFFVGEVAVLLGYGASKI